MISTAKRLLMLARQIVLSLSLVLVLVASADAQERLPCGVVTSSIKLTASCEGPMVIAADNITIDLGGYYVGSEDNDSLIMKDRSGVVIKNGSVGMRGSVLIQGGRNNRLQDLVLDAPYQGGGFVLDSQNARLQRINFFMGTDARGLFIGGKGTAVSESTFRVACDAVGEVLFLGSEAIASRNTFFGAARGNPSLVVGARARVEYNTIEWWPECVNRERPFAAVLLQGNGAVALSNLIRISGAQGEGYERISGILAHGSRSAIKANTIVMSSPEVSSVGIVVSPESSKNIIQKNRISGGDSPDDVGIYVLGSNSKIVGNNTDSVVNDGTNNVIKRNVVTPFARAKAKR